MVMLVATFFAAGDERAMRLGAAFHWNGVLAPTNVRVDAWVTPPLYTGKPPVILSAANKEAAALPASGPLAVPAGSTLIVRSSGGSLDVVVSGGLKEVAPTEAAPKGTNEKHFTISGDGTAHVRAPSGQPQWAFAATPDRAPTIALAKDPERQARGGLQLSYKIEDDYGVTGADAQIGLRPADAKMSGGSKDADTKAAARPLFQPPQFPLVLPNARTRNGVGQTVKDLSEDPYAGADVTLTLTAKDEAGNEARSEPFNMRLPERLFTNSLARALVEQRRILALDANKNSDVYAALDALMIAPELFTPDAGCYLGLRSLALQLEAARTDDALREVVESMWAFAVTIEDDGVAGSVNAALRVGAGCAQAGAGTRRQRGRDQGADAKASRGDGRQGARSRPARRAESAWTPAAIPGRGSAHPRQVRRAETKDPERHARAARRAGEAAGRVARAASGLSQVGEQPGEGGQRRGQPVDARP